MSTSNPTLPADSDSRRAGLDQIVKAYDIRGLVPQQWDEDTARSLGAATARVLALGETSESAAPVKRPMLVVGYDMRPSSPGLVEAFIAGATAVGVDVLNIGLCSTDGLYFASGRLNVPGAMFTASHNPAQYNGIKLCRAGAQAVSSDSGLFAIRDLAKEFLVQGVPEAPEAGQVSAQSMTDEYAAYLLQLVDIGQGRPLRIVVDAGNGMAGLTVPAVFDRVGAAVISIEPLYFELDGTFPNHEANPLDPANLVDLQRAVVERSADLGLAFDGDADRCFVVDERGIGVSPSAVTALVAEREIRRAQADGQERPVVLHNAITSSTVPQVISQAGGTPVRTKVGHSHIKAEMARTGAIFGGEHSAHYYFKDFWGADTGMLAALHVVKALQEGHGVMSELMAEYDRTVASGEINSTVSDGQAATARVLALWPDDQVHVDRLDGVTISALDGSWWVNVRLSNTEPLLRLNVEAADAATMQELRDMALRAIRQEEQA